jgi:hypothetical protein
MLLFKISINFFCTSNTQQFGKISNVGLISEKLIGQGILMADGERWSNQRRVRLAIQILFMAY